MKAEGLAMVDLLRCIVARMHSITADVPGLQPKALRRDSGACLLKGRGWVSIGEWCTSCQRSGVARGV